jgi:hypothetical protein
MANVNVNEIIIAKLTMVKLKVVKLNMSKQIWQKKPLKS